MSFFNKKSNIFLTIVAVALVSWGIFYTNCGAPQSEKESTDPNNSQNTQLVANVGYAKEFVGKSFDLPLTGAKVTIEELKVTPPKGSDQRAECKIDINSVLESLDVGIIQDQVKGIVVSAGSLRQNATLYLATIHETYVECRGECPTTTGECCLVMGQAQVTRAPTSNFKPSKDLIGVPLRSTSGKTFKISKVVSKNNVSCLIDQNEIISAYDNSIERGFLSLDLIGVQEYFGGHTYYVCQSTGFGCEVHF